MQSSEVRTLCSRGGEVRGQAATPLSLSKVYFVSLSLSLSLFFGLDSRTFHRKSLNYLCFLFVLNLIDLNIVLLVLKFLIGCNLKMKTNE